MKNRIIGLDLLRFLAMLGIVGLHVMNQGGIIGHADVHSFSYVLILMLFIIFYTSVNIFGILSGYLNVEKEKNNNSRIVELLLIVFFWSLLITTICFATNMFDVRQHGIKEFIHGVFPPLVGNYWYITCYVLLFFMIPYINVLLKKISKQKYKQMLIVLFVLFCIIQNILGYIDLFRVGFGYSPFWLIYCYMIGGYIKKYGLNIEKKKQVIILICSLLSACIVNYVWKLASIKFLGHITKNDWFIDYISPFTLVSSIMIILLFSTMNLKNKFLNKVFVYLSGMAFSVYIVHDHRIIFFNFLKDLFVPLLEYNVIVTILLIVGIILVIYVGCCILDEIRKLIFKLFRINKLIDFIGKKLDKVLN